MSIPKVNADRSVSFFDNLVECFCLAFSHLSFIPIYLLLIALNIGLENYILLISLKCITLLSIITK